MLTFSVPIENAAKVLVYFGSLSFTVPMYGANQVFEAVDQSAPFGAKGRQA